ncbi:MAG: hypothetical protein V2I57_06085, partial [Xanthomonadales bacterium]|nr:hypothetical protein [Xanthomonadales bacterium]
MIRSAVLLLATLGTTLQTAAMDDGAADDPAYVGTATCAGCHVDEHAAWQGSHHDHAMRHAGP